MKVIAFIGAGKMAEAIFPRLPRERIIVSDKDKRRLEELVRKYEIEIAENNVKACQDAGIIILSVKPQQMAEVLDELAVAKSSDWENKLIISIAAGVPIAYINSKLKGCNIVRAMPNNPCLVGMGITALVKGRAVGLRMYKNAEAIFKSVGQVVWVPENWMDAITGLSGSGPAFVYQVIEAMAAGGIAAGLSREIAEKLALQTICGAAGVIQITKKNTQELTGMVASPGGTTVEGLKVLQDSNFKEIMIKAIVAAAQKSKQISQSWNL